MVLNNYEMQTLQKIAHSGYIAKAQQKEFFSIVQKLQREFNQKQQRQSAEDFIQNILYYRRGDVLWACTTTLEA